MILSEESLALGIASNQLSNGNYPGRRRRVFCHTVKMIEGPILELEYSILFRPDTGVELSYNGVYDWICSLPVENPIHKRLNRLPICYEREESVYANAELPRSLQDLADEIQVDIHEALNTIDNPKYWYPGADVGISNDHVQAVIKALQRELDREPRDSEGRRWHGNDNIKNLPVYQLSDLSQSTQRALVERRRLRFQQFGITPKSWSTGTFSLWDVPEDPLWLPRQVMENSESIPSKPPRLMPDKPDPVLRWVYRGYDHARFRDIWDHTSDGVVFETELREPIWDE